MWEFERLEELAVVPRTPRFTPRNRNQKPWSGAIVAIDTEGSADTGAYSATVCVTERDGLTWSERFTDADGFVEFLVERAQLRIPHLIYMHNLEWDYQVLLKWCAGTRLRYEKHIARRNGSALAVTFDYQDRHPKHRKIVIRDSFAVFPMSLAQLGKVVGLPKLRTPDRYVGKSIRYDSGLPAAYAGDPDAPPCDVHGRDVCEDCYDLRDAEILNAAVRLYVDECNDAAIRPAFTRSAHAMRDFRTNYLPAPLMQYTEKANLRAEHARRGGRSEMLVRDLVIAEPDEIIMQADVNSEYPFVMLQGKFGDANNHLILHHCRPSRVDEYVGWAWCEVVIPALPLGPLIVRDNAGRISYPTETVVQGAWTCTELSYAKSLGCQLTIARLEGTPLAQALDPFGDYVRDKWAERARFKAAGDPREISTKLCLNGLSGKFGMRWTEDIVAFRALDRHTEAMAVVTDRPLIERADIQARRYPDYVMVPWSAEIMARGRVMVHRYGMGLIARGAQLLCCDTDSWTFRIRKDAVTPELFGDQLGEWKEEGHYAAFRGVAPKEYALYADLDELANGDPSKARAKGVGTNGAGKGRAVDYYLRTGGVFYQRPAKTRSVLRGAPMATFVTVEKHRHPRVLPRPVDLHPNFPEHVKALIAASEAGTLWARRHAA